MNEKREKIGVIDIGSNSVRLVVYDSLSRVPLPLLNEKVLCGLAQDLESTGKLYAPGVEMAYNALGRFAVIIRAMRLRNVSVFATSAIRDSADGAAFVKNVERDCGFKINILSGEEEARLAAMGIASSFYEARGVVGDFGGGSLELANLEVYDGMASAESDDIITQQKSFAIGALRLQTASEGNIKKAKEIISRKLAGVELGKDLKNKNFYAVGGGFRAIAKLHISRSGYPMDILHHYKISRDETYQTVKWILASSLKDIRKVRAFSAKRLETVPYAAAVMEKIIKSGRPQNIIFSTHGVREGMIFDLLDYDTRLRDPLIISSSNMMQNLSPGSSDEWIRFGHELYNWMSPMFRNEDDRIKRLRLAACILSHLSWYEHTAYKAEMAFRWIMDSSIPGLNHQERAFLALASYHRHKPEPDRNIMRGAYSLLDKDRAFRARIIGVAMLLGYQISGGAPGVLAKARLELSDKNRLLLKSRGKNGIWLGENVNKVFDKLSKITGLRVEIKQ